MKLLQFKKRDRFSLGIKTEQGILDVEAVNSLYQENGPICMAEVIALGEAGIRQLDRLVEKAETDERAQSFFLQEAAIEYAPVITQPEKIICVGLNYMSHAVESKMEIPKSPILFSKFNNALAAHQETVSLPPQSEKIDYEAELVIVVGQTAKNVSKEEALSYVFGYTAGNDLSARDLQFKTGQWLLGKTCDQFAPVGPTVVTANEIPNPNQLAITCTVNGVVRQSANTRDMIFDCATLLSYVSEHMTLQPGDLIFTGTPQGVILGHPEAEQKWLQTGDEVIISIEKIGTLQNVLA